MELEIREYCEADLPGMAEIWNAIVEQGDSFPQEERMALNRFGFRGLQFNAVVCTNRAAIHLYEKLGFTRLGVTPEGYRMKDESFQDLWLFYKRVT